MQLFRSPGISDTPQPARPRSYRWLRFGLRREQAAAPQAHIDADVAACVRALTRVQPAHWEDVVASYDRAA